MDPTQVRLGITDGLPGLEKVFLEEFTSAKVQRCQVHVARNILAKVPKKLKKKIADEVRSMLSFALKWKSTGDQNPEEKFTQNS